MLLNRINPNDRNSVTRHPFKRGDILVYDDGSKSDFCVMIILKYIPTEQLYHAATFYNGIIDISEFSEYSVNEYPELTFIWNKYPNIFYGKNQYIIDGLNFIESHSTLEEGLNAFTFFHKLNHL